LRLAIVLGLAIGVLGGCGSTPTATRSDWEEANAGRLAKEGDDAPRLALPPAPRPSSLVEFPGSTAGFRFYVDTGSLSVSGDGLVRYVLVARSESGAENITYEAINCRTLEHRLYASGRKDGSWQPVSAPWRALGPRTPAQRALAADYFCPRRIPVASAAEGAMALRRGGHPLADQQPLGSTR
jgi:hypothetical protein